MGVVKKAGGEGQRGEEAHCAEPCDDLVSLRQQSPGECLEQRADGIQLACHRTPLPACVENRRQEEQGEEEETCQEVMPAIRAGEDSSGDQDGTDGRQREVESRANEIS